MADSGRSPGAPPQGAAPDSLLDLARSILRELPALVGERVELLSLELQQAGAALARLVALAAAAAIFALTAWLALWGVVVGLLMALGAHWALAHAVALLINAAAAGWALVRARSMARLLGLPATRRHLLLGLREPASPHEEPVVTPGAIPAS
ncbi:MAG TPA: phage holin family protein [Burkholderiaceae bacterium]